MNFKPASASNEAFLQGFVKESASNQLQPQMTRFLKDLYKKRESFKPAPASHEAFL